MIVIEFRGKEKNKRLKERKNNKSNDKEIDKKNTKKKKKQYNNNLNVTLSYMNIITWLQDWQMAYVPNTKILLMPSQFGAHGGWCQVGDVGVLECPRTNPGGDVQVPLLYCDYENAELTSILQYILFFFCSN